MRVLNVGKGYGTYLMALIAVAGGAWGWLSGNLEPMRAQEVIWTGLVVFGFRRAMN